MKPIYIFLLLCFAFLIYSFGIYFSPTEKGMSNNEDTLNIVAKGKMVWQKYNCQSCHQLYGLGGYLGPDLTNIVAQEGKGELFIKVMVQSGTKQMPAFKLSDEETSHLFVFLNEMNQTGNSDPRSFHIFSNGMIEPNEK
ncbi:MAG: cytochrome c [bacterium]|nr:cytochrome c [bacterium]